MYEYLSKKLGPSKVYRAMLTIPIIASFTNPVMAKKLIENSLYVAYPTSAVTRKRLTVVLRKLTECNAAWNSRLDPKRVAIIRKLLQVAIPFQNPVFTETVRAASFILEIEGVIDRSDFLDKSGLYVDLRKHKVVGVDKAQDARCAGTPIDQCAATRGCKVRTSSKGSKSCVNKQRYRRVDPDSTRSQYIFTDEQTEQKFVYESLCVFRMVAGNAGVFRRFPVDAKTGNVNRKGTRTYTFTFPPFADGRARTLVEGFRSFYSGGYIQDVPAVWNGKSDLDKVGVQIGLYRRIKAWYEHCVVGIVPMSAEIFIVGVSLGGALANLAAFELLQHGFKNVHMYAFGAPRVGDEAFRRYMNEVRYLAQDSANYIRFNNVLWKNKFYTEYDPVAKFPPNTWSLWGSTGFGHLRFTNNPRLRVMAGGATFAPVLDCFYGQPDYDMIPYTASGYQLNHKTPIGADCERHWAYVHSMSSYSADVLLGAHYYSGNPTTYIDRFDAIRDLRKTPC